MHGCMNCCLVTNQTTAVMKKVVSDVKISVTLMLLWSKVLCYLAKEPDFTLLHCEMCVLSCVIPYNLVPSCRMCLTVQWNALG